jgi:hypothetical protein
MPKGRSALPPPVAAEVKTSPADDLDVIADLLSKAIPRLHDAARALRAQEHSQRETIQELTSQSAAKDARIAQLEALVAEADARSERSRAIHAEFEKRLLEEQQRWQATLESSQKHTTSNVSAAAASAQIGKRPHGNSKSPLSQRPAAQNPLLPERPATNATPRSRPSTAPSPGPGTNAALANAPSPSEDRLALPAPRSSSKPSPPNALSISPFRDTTLKTMATPRTRADVRPASGAVQSGTSNVPPASNQTPRNGTPNPSLPKTSPSASSPLGSTSPQKSSSTIDTSIAPANSQRISPAGSAPDTPGRSQTSSGAATPLSSRGTTPARTSVVLGGNSDLLKA